MVITIGSPSSFSLVNRLSRLLTSCRIQWPSTNCGNVLLTQVGQTLDNPQLPFDGTKGRGMSVMLGRVGADSAFHGVEQLATRHTAARGASDYASLTVESMKSQGHIG